MRLLIDTECWLWCFLAPERLNGKAQQLIADERNEILLSAVSAWEIAIKAALGKLSLPEEPTRYVPTRLADQGMLSMPVEQAHALRVYDLPPHHKDPFDRLLIAQAQVEGLPILTSDRAFARYEVSLIWGREAPSVA